MKNKLLSLGLLGECHGSPVYAALSGCFEEKESRVASSAYAVNATRSTPATFAGFRTSHPKSRALWPYAHASPDPQSVTRATSPYPRTISPSASALPTIA